MSCWLKQVAGELLVIEREGSGFPLIVMVAVLLHPAELVPVTVYVMLAVEVGVTVTLVPVVPLRFVPGLHE